MNKKTKLSVFIAIIAIILIGSTYFLGNNNQTVVEPNDKIKDDKIDTNKDLKTLVVYFSVPETNNPDNMTRDEDNSTYVVDGEVLGNTQYVAMLIQRKMDGAIFRLEPTNAYPTNHGELLKRAQEEMENDVKPEIADKIEDFENYDVIFIGYPIWNASIPPIIEIFLSEYDFTGKTVIPFCTHGGSGLSNTPNTIAKLVPNANVVQNGLAISRTNMDKAESEVTSWLEEIN